MTDLSNVYSKGKCINQKHSDPIPTSSLVFSFYLSYLLFYPREGIGYLKLEEFPFLEERHKKIYDVLRVTIYYLEVNIEQYDNFPSLDLF